MREGVWSAPFNVATDVSENVLALGAFALAPLEDGRVALAYVTSAETVRYGFFDGAAWGAFSTAPGNAFNTGLGLTRGASGATLELVYAARPTFVMTQTRLTNEATNSWSPAAAINAGRLCSAAYLARLP